MKRSRPVQRDGFRETFLVRFTRKPDADALRRLAVLVSELYVNSSPGWWPAPREGDLRALLWAVVRDLRYMREVLAQAERGEWYDRGEVLLASFARHCAVDVEGIAAAIEQALADPEGTAQGGSGPN